MPEEAGQGMTAAELLAIVDDGPTMKATDPGQAPFVAPPQLIRMYLQQTPVRIGELRHALANSDWPLLARAAHTLKGNSSYVGADELGRLGGAIELCVDEGNFKEIPELIDQLEGKFAEIQPALLACLEDEV